MSSTIWLLAGALRMRVESNSPISVSTQASSGLLSLLDLSGPQIIEMKKALRPSTNAPARDITVTSAEGIAHTLNEVDMQNLASKGEAGIWQPNLGQRKHASGTSVVSLETIEGDQIDHISPLARPSVHKMVSGLGIVVCAVVAAPIEYLDVTFTDLVSITGVLACLFLGGVLPSMLAISSRRRSERTTVESTSDHSGRFIWLLVLLFWLVGPYKLIFGPIVMMKIAGLIATVVTSIAIIAAVKHQSFTPRSTISIQMQPDGLLHIAALQSGVVQPSSAPIHMPPAGQSLVIELPQGLASPIFLVKMVGTAQLSTLGSWTLKSSGIDAPVSSEPEDIGELITHEFENQPLSLTFAVR